MLGKFQVQCKHLAGGIISSAKSGMTAFRKILDPRNMVRRSHSVHNEALLQQLLSVDLAGILPNPINAGVRNAAPDREFVWRREFSSVRDYYDLTAIMEELLTANVVCDFIKHDQPMADAILNLPTDEHIVAASMLYGFSPMGHDNQIGMKRCARMLADHGPKLVSTKDRQNAVSASCFLLMYMGRIDRASAVMQNYCEAEGETPKDISKNPAFANASGPLSLQSTNCYG